MQRYAPWGAYLTLSFRKKCSGTPPEGVTRLHFSLTWGLTDRQVSLPPFRALPRSGGPELSKNLDSSGLSGAGFRQLLLSWGAGFRQLLFSSYRGEPASASSFFVLFVGELASANSRPDAFASGALATPLGNSGLSCFRG